MYNKILIPLDGSKTAEKVLPYARYMAGRFKIPVELLAVIDIAEIGAHMSTVRARFLDTMVEDTVRASENYLRGVAGSFKDVTVKTTIQKGRPEDAIITNAETDKSTLIAMATHGRSGLDRFLLGSVAEKVLRGTANPLLLARASETASVEGEATFNSVIVPLDGSEVAEKVLPTAVEMAQRLDLEIVLFRAYHIPYNAYSGNEGFYAVNFDELMAGMREEANEYLQKKVDEVKKLGGANVSAVAKEGFAGDEIIALARSTPNGLIAMSSHGRSGMKRWVLGSVAETVVRHSADPVLVIRAN